MTNYTTAADKKLLEIENLHGWKKLENNKRYIEACQYVTDHEEKFQEKEYSRFLKLLEGVQI